MHRRIDSFRSRWSAVLLAAVVVAVLTAGCADDDGADGEPQVAPSESTSSSVRAPEQEGGGANGASPEATIQEPDDLPPGVSQPFPCQGVARYQAIENWSDAGYVLAGEEDLTPWPDDVEAGTKSALETVCRRLEEKLSADAAAPPGG